MSRHAIPPQWAADPGSVLSVVPLAGLGWRFLLAAVLGSPAGSRRRGSLGAAAADHKKKTPERLTLQGWRVIHLDIFSSSNRTATGKIRMQNSVILSPLKFC